MSPKYADTPNLKISQRSKCAYTPKLYTIELKTCKHYDGYENLQDYFLKKKKKMLIVVDDMIADMENNNKIKSYSHWIFFERKKNYETKKIRLNATHYFTRKIPNKRELQQITTNNSSDITFKDFLKLYKDYTKEPFSLLVNNTPLQSDNPLRFRKDLLINDC